MKKRKNPKRRKTPSPVVKNLFGSSLIEFTSEFLKSDSFGHALSKGEEREVPIINFFAGILPKTYSIGGGEVIDLRDRQSPQLDVMIWDQVRNIAFFSGNSSIIPAEALLVSIEVKSKLTKAEIKKSLEASAKLHKLEPFQKPLSLTRSDGDGHDGNCRYFHCIFAYDSDLSNGESYLQRESSRYNKLVEELKLPVDIVQRIYIANRGLLNPGKDFGIEEDSSKGRALMHFYLDIFNFLSRENSRREAAPYISYIGRIGKDNWVRLSDKYT